MYISSAKKAKLTRHLGTKSLVWKRFSSDVHHSGNLAKIIPHFDDCAGHIF